MGFLKRTANFVTFGTVDRSDAKKITKNANRRKDDIKEELDDTKEKTQKDIKNLGILKETTYSKTISNFVFSQLDWRLCYRKANVYVRREERVRHRLFWRCT